MPRRPGRVAGAGVAVLDRDLKLTLAESPTSHPRALRTDQHAGLALADITHNDATGDTPPR